MSTQLNEHSRLEALHSLNLLDTPPDAEFDELVTLVAEICSVPIAAVSLVDSDRQWCKATFGRFDQEIPRDFSFCSHAIRRDELLIVEDALLDPRFNQNPLVTGPPGIRFYAGIPLVRHGQNIGALCVIDTIPRRLTQSQQHTLKILARHVQARLEAHTRERLLEQALAENQRLTQTITARINLFRAFMDNGPFVSFIKDSEGRFLFYNQRMRENFGVQGDAWMGKSDHELWPASMADEFRAHDLLVLEGGQPVIIEEKSTGPNNTVIAWRSYKFPLRNEQGEMMLAGIAVDMTEELKQQQALKHTLSVARQVSRSLDRSHALFRTFLDNIPYHCYLKSEDGRYLFYNQKFAQHFGIHSSKWIGRTDHDLVPARLADQLRAHDLRALASDEIVEAIGEFANTEGVLSTFKLLKFRCTDEDGGNLLACVAVNITGELHRQQALTEANQKLEQLAASDALTGLSNRRTFDSQLSQHFAAALHDTRPLSLVILDVDNFKRLNDTYGHVAGDVALRAIARTLSASCRPGDIVARIGGEEFAFILPQTDSETALLRADKILNRIRTTPGSPVPLTVSIGVSTTNPATPTQERLFLRADDAMYIAKRNGKDRVVAHQSQIEELMRELSKAHRTARA